MLSSELLLNSNLKATRERNKLPLLTCLPFIDGSPQVLQPSPEAAEPDEIFESILLG